jgi:cellulose synthase/poly-beta-1,6-N-acetylglucosamine synthase-like glycosyltransferase
MRFSIVVPTHNRPDLLDRCLDALEAQDFPAAEFEVLVVDDGSNPPMDPVFAKHTALKNLRTFRTSGGGPAKARNLALRHAQGEYAVFTDDDCAPDPRWLSAFHRAFQLTPDAGLGGRILDSPLNNVCGRTSQILVSFLYDYFGARNGLNFFCSNNFAFPREPLQAIGGFDESFPLAAAEDRELCARWMLHGALHYVPDAIVVHRQFLNFRSFCRQQYRYGRGAFQFWLRRKDAGLGGLKLERGNFYTAMLTYPYPREPFFRALTMTLLLALSQFFTAMGYFYERSRMAEHAPAAPSPNGTRP